MAKRKQVQNTDDTRIHLKSVSEDLTKFQKEETAERKHWSIVTVLFFVYAAVFFCSLFFLVEHSAGSQWIYSPAYVLDIIRKNLENFYNFVIGNGTPGSIDLQILRYLIVGLTGATLAACGALMQGTLRNVLAGPSTLGVQAGGTLGNLLYILLLMDGTASTITVYHYEDLVEMADQSTFFSRNIQQIFILAGCIGACLLVLGVAVIAGHGKVSSAGMILTGMVFSSVISSFCGVVQYYMIVKNPSDPRIMEIRSLSMGSLDRAYSLEHFLTMAVVLIPCIVIMALCAGKVNQMSMGEETAYTMGVNVRKYKIVIMVFSTIMTAVTISYVGHIGFIGFMAPQLVRKSVGADFRKLFPASVAAGAILLTLIYDMARFFGMIHSLNLFTSLIGSAAMLIVLLRKKGGGRNGSR